MVNKDKQPALHFYQSQLFQSIIQKNPIVLIDAGARGGIHQKWQPLKKVIQAIGFEPDAEECQRLNLMTEAGEVYLPVALFDRKGKINIYLTRKSACSSILKPNYPLINRFWASENYEVIDTVEVRCDTLDELVKSGGIKDIDFIKIDTQGSELQILEGAEQALAELCVFGVEVEVEFSPLYQDESLFADVDRFLRQKGFALFDIKIPLGRKIRKTVHHQSQNLKGQGLWTNALYFRDFVSGNNCLGRLNLEKAAKTMALAELHGFNDFALELLDFYRNKGIVPEPMCGEIRETLLPAEKIISPEIKLYQQVKRDFGEFLSERFPALHKWLVSKISPTRE